MSYPIVIKPDYYQNKETNNPQPLEKIVGISSTETLSGADTSSVTLSYQRIAQNLWLVSWPGVLFTASATDTLICPLSTDIFQKGTTNLISGQYSQSLSIINNALDSPATVLFDGSAAVPQMEFSLLGNNFTSGQAVSINRERFLIMIDDY